MYRWMTSHTMASLELALLLYLVVYSASADTGCIAGNGGTCEHLEKGCNSQHGIEWNERDCVCNRAACNVVSQGSCPAVGQDGGVVGPTPLIPRPSNVTLELSSTTPECFSARVRWEWELPEDSTGATDLTGFQVESDAHCVYLNDSDAREVTFDGLTYNFDGDTGTSMRFKVRSLPYSSEDEAAEISQPVPTSCRDSRIPYQLCYCVPPKYGVAENIKFTTTLVTDNPAQMRIFLSWKHPNTPGFPDPTSYYIKIKNQDSYVRKYFRVRNTLNVTLPPVDAAGSYLISIQAYRRCAGLSPTVRNGCGRIKDVDVSYVYIHPSATQSVSGTHDGNLSTSTEVHPSTNTSIAVKPTSSVLKSVATSIAVNPTSSVLKSVATSIAVNPTNISGSTSAAGTIAAVAAPLIAGIGIIVVIIAIIACKIVRKPKPGEVIALNVFPPSQDIKQNKLPPDDDVERNKLPPGEDRVQWDELPPGEDRVQRDELPPGEDRVQRDELPPGEDRVQRDELPPGEDRVQRDELPPGEDRIQRDELPPGEDGDQTPVIRPPVLLAYSPQSPEREIRRLMQCLVKGLSVYGIDVTSHDLRSPRGSLSQWVEKEYQKAVAVLVVCNEQLHQDWHHQCSSTHPLVPALRHFINASVGKPADFSKIAVVLLQDSYKTYIPALLDSSKLSTTEQFSVDKVKDIAYFVKNTPRFAKP